MRAHIYDRLDFQVSEDTSYVKILRPDGKTDTVYPFRFQPISVTYDEEGLEKIAPSGEVEFHFRYTPDFVGEGRLEIHGAEIRTEVLTVSPCENHGYVEVGKTDSRYFAYTDGTPFFSVGINAAFPTAYTVSDRTEFGLSTEYGYIGLRQYERWFKKLSQNGVNVARVWLGHTYFNPDTASAYVLEDVKFSKIDRLFELARQYGIKLKLTVEQFRYFDYEKIADSAGYADDIFRKFNKRLYESDVRCENSTEWLTDDRWKKAWLFKVNELAKRYAGDTTLFALELWNEMNCMADFETVVAWNEEMLPEVKKLFPKNLVCNSLGSMDSEPMIEQYHRFCWDKSDFVQIHRYLDQGAPCRACGDTPLAMMQSAFELMKTDKPLFIAETGAVNNCHSGPFKFYVNDDRGILFADTVYPPVFLKSAGTGNIWHWDERYVEFKNLYAMFRPISGLVAGVAFENEHFESLDLSNEAVWLLLLKGKTVSLGYIRNKADNWKNTLRDMNDVKPVERFEFSLEGAADISCVRIWQEDKTAAKIIDGVVRFENIRFGTLFKIGMQ